jgi:hypothetical protein
VLGSICAGSTCNLVQKDTVKVITFFLPILLVRLVKDVTCSPLVIVFQFGFAKQELSLS